MAKDQDYNYIRFGRRPRNVKTLSGQANYGIRWVWHVDLGYMRSDEGVEFNAPTELP